MELLEEVCERKKVKEAAFKCLIEEISNKDRTKHIMFEELKISDYLWENKSN